MRVSIPSVGDSGNTPSLSTTSIADFQFHARINLLALAGSYACRATVEPPLSPEVKVLANVPISVPNDYVSGQAFHPFDWSPGGQAIAYSWRDAIWIVRGPEFKPARLVSVPNGTPGEVYYSPDGLHLAFRGGQLLEQAGLEGQYIWVVNSDGTDLKNLLPDFAPYSGKLINQWNDNHLLTFNFWRGSGVQTLYQVDVTNDAITPLIELSEHAKAQAICVEYHWSPNREYIAIQGCCLGNIFVARASALEDRRALPTSGELPDQKFQSWLPDGRRFLYLQREDTPVSEANATISSYSLWVWAVAQWEGRKLLDKVYAAVLSPDGSHVALLRQENRTWRPPDGSELAQAALPALTLERLDLATSKTIAYGSAGYKVQEAPREPRYWQVARPVWSPDGELLVYWDDEGDVRLGSAEGQSRLCLTQRLEIVQVLWSPDGNQLALRSLDQVWIIQRPAKIADRHFVPALQFAAR